MTFAAMLGYARPYRVQHALCVHLTVCQSAVLLTMSWLLGGVLSDTRERQPAPVVVAAGARA